MKYIIILLQLLIFNYFSLLAQSHFGFSDAMIHYKNGDSMLCQLKREIKYGDKITYKRYEGDDEKQLNSNSIKSIDISNIHLENISLEGKENFATLLLQGSTSLYSYVEMKYGDTVDVPKSGGLKFQSAKSIVHYIIKSTTGYFEIRENNFENDLILLLPDCGDLHSQLKNHALTFSDIPAIIKFHNSCSG